MAILLPRTPCLNNLQWQRYWQKSRGITVQTDRRFFLVFFFFFEIQFNLFPVTPKEIFKALDEANRPTYVAKNQRRPSVGVLLLCITLSGRVNPPNAPAPRSMLFRLPLRHEWPNCSCVLYFFRRAKCISGTSTALEWWAAWQCTHFLTWWAWLVSHQVALWVCWDTACCPWFYSLDSPFWFLYSKYLYQFCRCEGHNVYIHARILYCPGKNWILFLSSLSFPICFGMNWIPHAPSSALIQTMGSSDEQKCFSLLPQWRGGHISISDKRLHDFPLFGIVQRFPWLFYTVSLLFSL